MKCVVANFVRLVRENGLVCVFLCVCPRLTGADEARKARNVVTNAGFSSVDVLKGGWR